MKIEITKDQLIDLYEVQKLSTAEIAVKFNCSSATIRNKMKKFGIKKRKKEISQTQRDQISATLKRKLASGEITPSFKDKHHKQETKDKLAQYKGEKNSQYGKKKSDEWKAKTSRTHKRDKKLSKYLKNRTPEQRNTQVSKAWATKKANGTTNTSKPEIEFYKKLKEENKTKHIYKNYKCERYPFYCDFYIAEDDLFIELNYHWTHGGKPFDPTDQLCLDQLAIWQEKAKTSKFYENAIITWTVRDVEKQKVAKENKLNYKVMY